MVNVSASSAAKYDYTDERDQMKYVFPKQSS